MNSMQITVLGAGNVGTALGAGFVRLGHRVRFGVRDVRPEHARLPAPAHAIAEAVRDARIVALAVPWTAVADTLRAAGDLAGVLLVDCTNPLRPDLGGLDLGHSTSGAERIAALAPKAKVVKAFHTIGTEIMQRPQLPAGPAFLPVCGDDADAVRTVVELATALGFHAVSLGGLSLARLQEPLAMLWIHMAFRCGFGREFGFVASARTD